MTYKIKYNSSLFPHDLKGGSVLDRYMLKILWFRDNQTGWIINKGLGFLKNL